MVPSYALILNKHLKTKKWVNNYPMKLRFRRSSYPPSNQVAKMFMKINDLYENQNYLETNSMLNNELQSLLIFVVPVNDIKYTYTYSYSVFEKIYFFLCNDITVFGYVFNLGYYICLVVFIFLCFGKSRVNCRRNEDQHFGNDDNDLPTRKLLKILKSMLRLI
jgi:putative membrane protein